MTERTGWLSIRVLPDLEGKPWNEIARAYLRALRPSVVQVIEHGGCVRSNAIAWRVTVYLTERRTVERIAQEVEVDIPEGVAHGHDLNCLLEAM